MDWTLIYLLAKYITITVCAVLKSSDEETTLQGLFQIEW